LSGLWRFGFDERQILGVPLIFVTRGELLDFRFEITLMQLD
jgi:hypothetical protein